MDSIITQGPAADMLRKKLKEHGEHWCDTVVTSPPYNIGIKYADKVSDKLPEVTYAIMCEEWMNLVYQSLKPEGHFFLNVGSLAACPMRPFQLLDIATRKGFRLQNTFHWIKAISFEGKKGETVSRGQFRPVNSRRFVNNLHEYVFHLTPHGTSPLDKLAIGVPYQDKSNIDRFNASGEKGDLRCRGNVWFIPYETIVSSEKQRPHPATFPVELVENCIRIAGSPPVVMDPFVGSGTSGIAAKNCGAVHFEGNDLSESYAYGSRIVIQKHLPTPK